MRADHVVTPAGVLHDAVIEIAGDRIVSCSAYAGPADPEPEHVAGWVVPGFVDIHVHGGGGCDYATEDPQVAIEARAFHAAHGTTSTLASLVTAPPEVLARQLATIADLVDDGYFAGVHLEGPFLSPAQPGAHEPSLLRTPDPARVERLITAGRGRLALVTLAPELPGAPAAITQFLDAGVRVAVGHTDADRDAVAAALDAGATVATHLFNAMRSVHHREPGPVPAAAGRSPGGRRADRRPFPPPPRRAADGGRRGRSGAGPARHRRHVRRRSAGRGVHARRPRRRVQDGMARLVDEDGTPGAIAGSTLTMAEAFQTMTGITGRHRPRRRDGRRPTPRATSAWPGSAGSRRARAPICAWSTSTEHCSG